MRIMMKPCFHGKKNVFKANQITAELWMRSVKTKYTLCLYETRRLSLKRERHHSSRYSKITISTKPSKVLVSCNRASSINLHLKNNFHRREGYFCDKSVLQNNRNSDLAAFEVPVRNPVFRRWRLQMLCKEAFKRNVFCQDCGSLLRNKNLP